MHYLLYGHPCMVQKSSCLIVSRKCFVNITKLLKITPIKEITEPSKGIKSPFTTDNKKPMTFESLAREVLFLDFLYKGKLVTDIIERAYDEIPKKENESYHYEYLGYLPKEDLFFNAYTITHDDGKESSL